MKEKTFDVSPNLLMLMNNLILLCTGIRAITLEESGPRFAEEWQSTYAYSSRLGGKLSCRVHGQPKPKLQWVTNELFPVTNITSIREVDDEGNLYLRPFEVDKYRPELHAAVYRCRASNSVGSIISPEIQTRAAKWFMLPNGDLYVFNVDIADGYKSFACRTSHKLTNEAKTSQTSRIIVKVRSNTLYTFEGRCSGRVVDVESQYSETEVEKNEEQMRENACPKLAFFASPTFTELVVVIGETVLVFYGSHYKESVFLPQGEISTKAKRNCVRNRNESGFVESVDLNTAEPLRLLVGKQDSVKVVAGEDVYLPCLAQGNPPPTYTWYRDRDGILGDLLQSSSSAAHAGKSRIGGVVEAATAVGLVLPALHLIWEPFFSLKFAQKIVRLTSVASIIPYLRKLFVSNFLSMTQNVCYLFRFPAILPKLMYRFSEQTLQPGPSVSLKCTAVGNPPPQFQWMLDGFPLPENERYLVGQYVTIHDNVISHVNITNVQAEDGGLYTAVAKNAMGSVYHSARLNIYGPPFIRQIPPIKAVAGRSLQVQCPVSGYPIETISWEKGGNALPVNRMQRVYPNGTLIIEHIQKGTDEGIFTCHARNRQGLSSSRDIQIKVIVPPKIMPFQFTNHLLREGMRAAVSCTVLEGDRPIDLVWEFEGKTITAATSQGLNVRIPDEYTTTLIIESLSSAHNGKYTCRAENSAGREYFSSELTVQIPPKWTVEPRDINVAAGQSVALHCQADGHPQPSIVWKRATGTQPGEYKDLSGATTGIYSNGTIRFDHVKKSDEASYLCEARNDVGSGLSKVVFLKVNAPAQFADRDQQISVRSGEKAILQCRAKGDLPIDIQWSNKHTKIGSHSNHRYTVRQQTLDDGVMSELLVADVDRSDSGSYSCYATNSFGTDQTSVVLSVQEPPEQPVNLRLLETQSRSVQITWLESFNGNSPLINFIIQYKFPSDTWTEAEVEELAVPATQTTAVVDGLSPSTTYHLRVLAQNGMGFSPPSEVIQVTTVEEAPEGPPQDIDIEPISSTKLRIRWGHPNGTIAWIRPRLLSAFESSALHLLLNLEFTVGIDFGGEALIDNLRKFSRYAVIVQAFNSKGTGPPSYPVIGTTLQDVPSLSPENVGCKAISSQSLQITWDNPPLEGRNGVIQGYKVIYSPSEETVFPSLLLSQIPASSSSSSGGASSPSAFLSAATSLSTSLASSSSSGSVTSSNAQQGQQQSVPLGGSSSSESGGALSSPATDFNVETKLTTERELSVHGLRRWTNYTISVLAFTAAGDGKLSEPVICHTDEDVPSPPSSIKALVSSRRSILVSWLPPEFPNGRIDKYTLYSRQMDLAKVEKKILQAHEITHEFTTLKEGQAYEFWVTASTKIGEGTPTSRVHISTTNKVAAKIASFSQSIDVAWKRDVVLLCDAVGVPEPSVQWQFNGNYIEMGSRRNVDVGGKLTILEVTPEDNGNYTCVAQNTHGTDSVSYHVRVQTPPQPPILQIAEASYEALRLTWTPMSDGGSPIKGYLINYKRAGGDWDEYEVGPRATSHVLQGLVCGSSYQVFITAFNKIGSGLPSDILTRSTKGSAPVAPKKQEMLHGNHSTISVRLDQWHDNGCPIIRFMVEYKTPSEKNWHRVPIEVTGGPKIYSLSSLQPATKYDIRVTAENHAGSFMAKYDFLTLAIKEGNLGLEEAHTERDTSNDSSSSLNTSLFIVFPSILSLLAVTGLIAFLCLVRRKRMGLGGTKTVIGDHHPAGLQTLMESHHTQRNNRDQHYCIVKSTDHPPGPDDPVRYKTIDSADYIDDICPYATFQLPEKPPCRPVLTASGALVTAGIGGSVVWWSSSGGSGGSTSTSGTLGKGPGGKSGGGNTNKRFGRHTGDTMYSVGNIYSGPYHSVQSPGFVYNQATIQLREPEYQKVRGGGTLGRGGSNRQQGNNKQLHPHQDFESQESDNMASTDSEVKKILTLHMPISEYDTLGSDSEGEKHHQNCSPIHHHMPPSAAVAAVQAAAMAAAARQHQQFLVQQTGATPMQIQHEMVTFRQRQRSDPVITSDHSSSSTDSSPTTGTRKSSYLSRKSKSKTSVQSGSSMKQRVRSSSGYSSHTEETSFSFCDRIQPPTRFSDSRDLSDGGMGSSGLMGGLDEDCDMHQGKWLPGATTVATAYQLQQGISTPAYSIDSGRSSQGGGSDLYEASYRGSNPNRAALDSAGGGGSSSTSANNTGTGSQFWDEVDKLSSAYFTSSSSQS
ncbi:Down syndrome cell adhesion molecule-like protein Dscam2 [Orchesella cincta]|uniref:Down syndrome cell adhesion molecule-like protein Dscam2 n=1 Tax=Orchesella cincta TaxID=48709 RepID=A0A1D2NGN7_ORCCI|nr:Down syndrome cell adhesion molecule-like protein Dscam2 [Orchesella cincta]